MEIFDVNFIFSCLCFVADFSDATSMNFEFNYQCISFVQRKRSMKVEYIVENFFDSSRILITCFEHFCELMVFDTYHNCLHCNERTFFQMVVDSIRVPKRKFYCCYRKSVKKRLKYFLRFIIKH